MTNIIRRFILVAVIMMIAAPVFSKPKDEFFRIFTSWDDYFLFCAFEVPDFDIRGKTTGPNQPVADDDAVSIYIDADKSKSAAVGPRCFKMTVSAAGGCEFSIGDGGKWTLKPITTFKYAVRREGTVNEDQDDDARYYVEAAVPWSEIGIKPDLGASIGFNAVIQMNGECQGFVSASKSVVDPADRDNPSKWKELWLKGPVQPLAVRSDDKVLCNKVLSVIPQVDGRLFQGEYSEKSSYVIPRPKFETLKHVLRDFPIERMVFGTYYPDQANGKPAKEGAEGFVNHPYGGVGPWFDSSLISWHRRQLYDARRAGVDVILAMVDSASPGWLSAMVGALYELDSVKIDFPRVGLCLAQGVPQDNLWAVIRDFYLAVPPQFRAEVRLPVSKGGGAALVVCSRGPAIAPERRREISDLCRKTFGMGVVWMSSADGSDAVVPSPRETGFGYSDKGWIKTASITPGFVSEGKYLSRANAGSYSTNWEALRRADPDWIVVESINDWKSGSQIAPSSEYGYVFADATALEIGRFNAVSEFSARYVSASVPSVVSSEYMTLARIDARNGGSRTWKASERIRLGYRWYLGGRLYTQGIVQVPLQEDVSINGTARLSVGVIAVDNDKDPLPEGDWMLVFDFFNPDGRLFSSLGDRPLAVPVKVGKTRELAGTVIGAVFAPILSVNEPNTGKITVRNDGSKPWVAGGQVALRVEAVDFAKPESSALASWDIPLGKDIAPGRIAEVPIQVNLKGLVKQDSEDAQPQRLLLRVSVNETGKSAISNSQLYPVTAGVGGGYLAILEGPETPVTGHEYGKPTRFVINVTNRGPKVWSESSRLVARLYSLDGILLNPECGEGKFKKGLKPGETVAVNVEMRSPAYPGQYVVKWAVVVGNKDLSTLPMGGPSWGVFTQYITVAGPALQFVDLKPFVNTDAFASEALPSDGNFDGTGEAASSILLPPLVVPNPSPSQLAPSGIYSDDAGTAVWNNLTSQRWISFLWPSRVDGAMNAVACKSQFIPIEGGSGIKSIHLLAAADSAREAEFKMVGSGGEKAVKVTVGGWGDPASGKAVAYCSAYRLKMEGLSLKPACLFDVMIPVDEGSGVTAVKLPDDKTIKVLGITVEKQVGK